MTFCLRQVPSLHFPTQHLVKFCTVQVQMFRSLIVFQFPSIVLTDVLGCSTGNQVVLYTLTGAGLLLQISVSLDSVHKDSKEGGFFVIAI